MHVCIVWFVTCLSSLSLWSKGRPWRLHQHEYLCMEYSEFSKTLVKWGSILYKASLTFYLPCYPVQLPNPLYHVSSFLHLMYPELRKCGGVKIFFIFFPSLSESRDEIPVKWGNLSHPKISNFGLCIENTKQNELF